MQIFVSTFTGNTVTLEVDRFATVREVQGQIQAAASVPGEFRLIFGGRPLDVDRTLADFDVTEESTLHLVINLRGGGKKRKKKVFTKPKKEKHKHKKVKLAILRYYQVDGVGKVKHLRKECPHEICGAGVFFAIHFNRYHCGKCGIRMEFNKDEQKA
eukprot:CAMPEP_0114508228 /NCGR_PEP_ID=MMETSP0109-20121206/12475_1 /TAXON_ID=29199 /ORGANISM="Chlorarachnion reptans, Strain CCCM449" /LENGTH=156 /DNA_ID=CAMNT_0001687121 /DNA_START=161 /DNA_END=631 /DNA_ORIENTATION=+